MFVYDIKVKKVSGMLKESAIPSGKLSIKSKKRLDENTLLDKVNGFYQNKYGLTVEAIDGYEENHWRPAAEVSVRWGKSGLFKKVAYALARRIKNNKRAYQVTGIRNFSKLFFEEANPFVELVTDEQYEAWQKDTENDGSLCFQDTLQQILENIARMTQNLVRPKYDKTDYDWESFSMEEIYDEARQVTENSSYFTENGAGKFYAWIPAVIKSVIKEDLTKLGPDGVILKAVCDELS